MTVPGDDTELFRLVRETLFTAVIGDVMDVAGLIHQFLPPSIRAIQPDMVVVGRAMTVLEVDCDGQSGETEPFGLLFRALDQLRPGEVYVAAGGSLRYALWGGLMTTRALGAGAAGAVLGGFHRDTREILGLGLPVFSAGAYAQDQRLRGRVVDFRCRVEFDNGVVVEHGDLIVGDVDGVLVVPAAHVGDVIAAATDKVKGEDRVRDMLGRGMTTEAIFAQTGIM